MENQQEELLRPTVSFVWRIHKLYEKTCMEAGNRYKFTQNEIDVLLFLSNNKQYNTAMDIVRYRCISKSLISKSVQSLVTKGYLKAEKDSLDRRNIHLYITAKAEHMVVELQRAQNKFIGTIKSGLTDEEVNTLSNIITKLSDHLDKHL